MAKSFADLVVALFARRSAPRPDAPTPRCARTIRTTRHRPISRYGWPGSDGSLSRFISRLNSSSHSVLLYCASSPPTRTGDGVLDVVPPAVAEKLGNPDCLPRIKGTMPLLHPQTVFENILFGGLYGMSRCFDILLANLFGIFAVLSLPLPLVTFDGLPFVGVVQLAGELDIDFRATVNLSFAQEFVQQYAEPEQSLAWPSDSGQPGCAANPAAGDPVRWETPTDTPQSSKDGKGAPAASPLRPNNAADNREYVPPSVFSLRRPNHPSGRKSLCSTSRRLAGSAYTSAGSTFPRLAKNTASS